MQELTFFYLRRAGHLCAALACILLFLPLVTDGSFAVSATQQESLHGAIQDFEALSRDTRRGMWRDSWEKLEKRFESIEKQGSDYAAEAYFYRARSLEELADRSKNKNDWQNASKTYASFSSRFKKHPLSDNADYNRAMILSGPLGDKPGAISVLDALITDYPDGDAFSDAITLRGRLAPESPVSGGVKPRPQQTAPTKQADIERQKQLYAAAASEWRSLLVDQKRGSMRDNWLNLEKAFASALKAAPDGPEAHKAAYQVGRSREELARRSGLKSDWHEASEYFATMSANYPESSLADDSLFSQAEILAKRLSDSAQARMALNALLSLYPGGDMAPKARNLINELPQGSSQTKPAAVSGAAPAKTPAPASASAPGFVQKVSGSSGSNTVKTPPKGAILRHLEWKGDSDGLVVTLELAGKAKYRRATLPADPAKSLPQRVRLDLVDCKLYSQLRQSVVLTGAPAAAINSSKQGGGVTRVEINLAAASSYKVSVLQNPYRLQVEIHSSKLLAGGEDLSKIRPVSSGMASARSGSNGNIVEQLGLGIKTIMIDAGHGGKDPGAVGSGIKESTVTLDLAKKLGAELKKKGFTVMYTRDSNRFVALEDRTGLANSKKADVFVSIHVNASTNKKLYGFETYYLDVARSDAARVVAARENAVNVGTASDLQFILSDLTRNTKKEESLALSKQVQNACISRLSRGGFTVRSNGVRSAPFYVLMGARMPAFLIEIGYLSHNGDARHIKNPKYIQAVANGITDGIAAYQKELNRLAR